MDQTKRVPSLSELEAFANTMRGQFVEPIYVWGEPGVIRWSRREPEHMLRYIILGPTGRLWRIIDAC